MGLTFDLVLAEESVTLKGADGIVKECVLREMNGRDRDGYLNLLKSRIAIDAQGRPSIKSFDGHQASLIAKCLFDEAGNPVPMAEINAFPASVQAALFASAQSLNALDEAGAGEVKND